MKIFVSWSKEPAKTIAVELKHFLSMALEGVNVWMSEVDIPKGSRWGQEVARQLDETHVGIVCCTANNLNEPWLHFEAGALSKSIKSAAVFPLCFGVPFKDLPSTLSQFQSVQFERDDVYNLLSAINDLSERPMKASSLDARFSRLWRTFEEDIKIEIQKAKPAPDQRGTYPTRTVRADEEKAKAISSPMKIGPVTRTVSSTLRPGTAYPEFSSTKGVHRNAPTKDEEKARNMAKLNELANLAIKDIEALKDTQLDENECAVLSTMARLGHSVLLEPLLESVGFNLTRLKHYLNELERKGYVNRLQAPGIPDFFECSAKGAAEAVKRNWV